MNRLRKLTLSVVLTLAAVAGCDKSEKGDQAKTPPAATPPAATPPAATPPAATPPAATPPAGAGTSALILQKPTRVAGTRWNKTDELSMTVDLGAGDKKQTMVQERRRVNQYEIVEVDAQGIVTRVRASYPERSEKEQRGEQQRDKPSPLTGNSYLAWFEGGAVKATRADGAEVTPAELDELNDDLDELGRPPVMELILAGRTWRPGERYAFTADELAKLAEVEGPKAPRPKLMALTLQQVDGGKATFLMETQMAVEGKAEMTMDLKGSVVIDTAISRPLIVEMGGPITGTAAGMPLAGQMKGRAVYEYVAK